MIRRTLLAAAAAVAVSARWAGAAEAPAGVDPVRLMQQVQKEASSNDETVQMSMQLVEAGGATSQRRGTYARKLSDPAALADLKLIRFSSPAELNGSAVLIHEVAGGADEQWLYLPAYRTSRRVPSSNRSDRYMGTDFFYEDVSNDKIDQYRYSVTGQDKIGGRALLVIEQLPQADEVVRESAYGKKLQWVDPERHLVARIDYFDKAGALVKRMEAAGPVQVAGRWRWSTTSMTDLRSQHRTTIQYSERKIDAGLDAGLFSVRSVERNK